MEIIKKYFQDLTPLQEEQILALGQLYAEWNEKINVISRKDIDHIYLKHVLHSLGIAIVNDFEQGARVLDLGTGGGFPGIPLAIFYPEVEFVLNDSIKKKLTVVQELVAALDLKNVRTAWSRVEELREKSSFDYVVSRAVAPLEKLWNWSKPLLRKGCKGELDNGLTCLKGGDLAEEISFSNTRPLIWELERFYEEIFFKEKYILHVIR